jgi:NAD(P)-dependent dehydrogenase (short-subunit alcohol dehydrogenase family)
MDLSMQGKTILITGATGGIGMGTAEALAGMAARVFVTGRSRDSAEAAVARLKARTGNDRIAFLLADLSTQAGVRSLARQFTAVSDSLHVLVNNAGRAAQARQLTEDGVESDFAVNVVAPFLLTHLLVEPLANARGARVVSLTGGSHPRRIDLDNLQAERSFAGLVTYSHAKVAMMAVMYEYAHRLVLPGITINVCYPGQARTSMTGSVTRDMLPGAARLLWPLFKLATRPDDGSSAAKASRSSVYLASSPEVEGVTGKYFDRDSARVDWPAAVRDAAAREHLWNLVHELTATEEDASTA